MDELDRLKSELNDAYLGSDPTPVDFELIRWAIEEIEGLRKQLAEANELLAFNPERNY